MLNKSLFGLVLLGLSANAGNITVAVAANVSYAINDLKKEFNKQYPNTNVRVTLGSSGKLTAQISNGAPYDIFLSANMKYPEFLYEKKLAITKPIVYAKGSLALLSSKVLNLKQGLGLLENKSIRKIAIASPKTAPYGIATIEALKNAKLYKKLKPKFVYAESISQTVAYTVNATDAGFVAKSSLYSPRLSKYKEGTHWAEVPSKLYTLISQGIVILKNKKADENKKNEIKAFYNFMQSTKAKQILKNYGYKLP